MHNPFTTAQKFSQGYTEHPMTPELTGIVYRQHPVGFWEWWDPMTGWTADKTQEPGPDGFYPGPVLSYAKTWCEPVEEVL